MKKATLYEITGDLIELNKLIENLVDENGEPREPTEKEFETMKEWFTESYDGFKAKFDNYCKFIKNLQLSAANAEAEKQNFKAENNRLTKRATAYENRAKAVRNLLRWGMERLNLQNFKSDVFTANIQNMSGKVIKIAITATQKDLSALPEKYLKPREVDTKAILQDLKDGVLEERDGIQNYSKVFVKDGGVLPFIHVYQPTGLKIS